MNTELHSRTEDYTVFVEGDELYADMLAAIDAARESVFLETYIIEDDHIGGEIAKSLMQAALTGLDVRLHIDGIGSLAFTLSDWPARLREAGVKVKVFNPPRFVRYAILNRRNHRKILVVDQEHAWLGGFNIHDECSFRHFGDLRWRDTHIRVPAYLARDAAVFFENLWANKRRWQAPTGKPGCAMLVSNHNWRQRHELRRALLRRFRQAKQRIWVTTPYFIPDSRTNRELKAAARRGIDVRVLVPYKSDRPIAQWAARAAYAGLLTAGVRIHEYQPRVIHAKTVLIDSHWSTIGTANIDYRSFFVNFEMNLLSESVTLNAKLAADYEGDLQQSVQIEQLRWSKRSWALRFGEFIAWAARRWL